MRGLDRLRRAKERIDGTGGDDRERLREAASEFLAAAAFREGWPAGLRLGAESVRAGLLMLGADDGGLSHGDLVGVTDADARQAADDLLRLCARAERACRADTVRRSKPVAAWCRG